MALWGGYYAFSIGVVILVILFIYFNLKKDKEQDLRCPECNFLVGDVEDIGDMAMSAQIAEQTGVFIH